MTGKGHYVDGRWITGGDQPLRSHDPATGQTVWDGLAAGREQIKAALSAARGALESWSMQRVEARIEVLGRFADQLRKNQPQLAEAISLETGKPRWESTEEVSAMIGKVPLSIQAYRERRSEFIPEISGAQAAIRYKPHGVVAVFGPFNFPGHLPNGHIVPALLAGNTIVFKPSEYTPLVAEKTVELWEAAGLPAGVLNLLQGGRETGAALAKHSQLDGLFFTGSVAAGLALHRAFAEHPEKILALEMGGNNPLIVSNVSNVEAAAYLTIQSAFITAGQRCSCARRLIVTPDSERFIEQLVKMMKGIRVGRFDQTPEPFMGPVISAPTAEKLLAAQQKLRESGGKMLVEMRRLGDSAAMLSPGLMDVSDVRDRPDEELFGPFLQLIRAADFDAAMREANNTRFGLCAGLFSDDAELFEPFFRRIRAGVISINRPTTGASGRLPFGGVGLSGNHRPSGYFAADYCSYPVASMERSELKLPDKRTPGFDIS